MSQSIVLKRSSLPGKVPDTGSLNLGEIAINTYDGKVFLKRSGSVQSIQELITTNVVNTGSITLTQTGSFGELVITQDANIQRDLYVSNDIIGNGDLDILGSFTASLETGYIYVGNASGRTISVPTSSITTNINAGTLATTGSNTFYGNQYVNGNVSASAFVGDGSGLTNINLDTELPRNGYDYNIDDAATINDFNSTSTKYIVDFRNESLVGTPIGQITYIANSGGDSQLIPGNDKIYLISGDEEVGYITNDGYSGSIVGIGDPVLFSASIDSRINNLGGASGIVSSSAQITSFGFVSGSYETNGRGILSGSISYTSITNIPSNIISSSAQLTTLATTGSNIFIGTQTITGSWIQSGSLTSYGPSTFSGLVTLQQVQETISLKPSLGLGTNNFDFNSGSIFYIAGLTGSGTWNVQNIPSSSNAATSLTFVIQQGATAYSASAFQLGGSAVSVKWLDGTIPTGSASSTDIIGLTAFRSGSSWNVIGSLSKFV